MQLKPFLISATAFVTVILAALGGLYAYDSARGDTIAKGVEIGGVDVGGLSPSVARERLRADMLAKVARPIVVHHGKRSWTLTPEKARIAVNIDSSVDQAVARSGSGNFISRSMRRLTGGHLDVDLTPRVTYSDNAVVHLIDRVRKATNRTPINAKVSYTLTSVNDRRGRDGLKVDAHALHDDIRAAIVSPTAKRSFVANTIHTKPSVTGTAQAKQFSTYLAVDRSGFKLRLFKDFRLVKAYNISVGMQGLDTPAGLYHIQDKQVNPSWSVPNSAWAGSLAGQVIPPGPADPIKARWLGIIDGAGIHGVDPSEYGSIGHAASHGCVRMTIDDVVDLYPRVPVGTPIYIA